jgi:hypothetical protein
MECRFKDFIFFQILVWSKVQKHYVQEIPPQRLVIYPLGKMQLVPKLFQLKKNWLRFDGEACIFWGEQKKLFNFWKQYSIIKLFSSLSWTKSFFYFSWVWLSQDFVSLNAQVDFITREVPKFFWVFHVSNPLYVIPPRNTKMHNYVVSIFGFANKYMTSKYDNVIEFHNNEH